MKRFLALLLSALVTLSFGGCVSSSSTSSTTKATTYTQGETATIDGIKVTLNSVTENQGGEFLKPANGNVFLVMDFTIENSSNDELTVSSMVSFEAYVDDTKSSISIEAITSAEGKSQLDGTVATGKKISGVIGYEVPSSWSKVEVSYKPGLLDTKKVTFAYSKSSITASTTA